MEKEENNYAFIDGNNLYRGVKNSGWKINFFRKEKDVSCNAVHNSRLFIRIFD